MTFKQVEYQNWENFKELKTWILYNFKYEYVINKFIQWSKSAETIITNYDANYIYKKKVDHESIDIDRKYVPWFYLKLMICDFCFAGILMLILLDL